MMVDRLLWPALTGVSAAAAGGLWLYFRRHETPAERERKRRLRIGREGRIADGMITEVRDNLIFYAYTIRGAGYMASQDVSELRTLDPGGEASLMGPVLLKYLEKNPANSIVLCEDWSGLPPPRPA